MHCLQHTTSLPADVIQWACQRCVSPSLIRGEIYIDADVGFIMQIGAFGSV